MTIIEYISKLKTCSQKNEEQLMEKVNLSPSELKGIMVIFPGEKILCNEFSKRMNLSISRSSRVIEKLVSNGYLNEKKNKEDKRATILSITPKGKNIKKKINISNMECEKKITSHLNSNEVEDIKKYLQKLLEIL